MADEADRRRASQLLGLGDGDRELVERVGRRIAGKEAHTPLSSIQHAVMEGIPVELRVPPDLRDDISTDDVERP